MIKMGGGRVGENDENYLIANFWGGILKPRSKFNFIALEIEGKIGLLVFCALAILWGFN